MLRFCSTITTHRELKWKFYKFLQDRRNNFRLDKIVLCHLINTLDDVIQFTLAYFLAKDLDQMTFQTLLSNENI